ncbi:MAG TPA: HTTM domain-containing protein, partial [Bacteroidia bacterium]
MLIIDWLIRLNSLTVHYTNEGVIPTSLLFDYQWKPGFYSLFLVSDSIAWCYFLFGVAILFSFFFTIGYFTRFSTLIVWILLCSVHVRQPFVLQGGDELLRITLFWCLFLPVAKKYSVDAIHSNKEEQGSAVFSAAGFGFMLLVFSVYFFSALLKTSAEWQSDGTAIYYALSLDQMVLPIGKWLLQFPALCKILTHFVFWTELIAPLLLVKPFMNPLFRTVGILLIVLMHIGIGSTLFVGLFFLVGISTAIGLLPSQAVNRIISRIPSFIKRNSGLLFFARILPSFNSMRNLMEKVLHSIRNFYTETILTFALVFVICVCIIWNLGNIKGTGLTITGPFKRMVYFLRIDQNWGMFSPGVFKDDGWFILEGSAKDKK